MRNDRGNVECRFVAGNLWWQVAWCGVSEITIDSLRSNGPGARREGGSVSPAILDRLSNEAQANFSATHTSGVSAALPPEKATDPIRQGYINCILDLASSFLLQAWMMNNPLGRLSVQQLERAVPIREQVKWSW